jgi:hypothetical protein
MDNAETTEERTPPRAAPSEASDMSRLEQMMGGEPVHTREVRVQTFPVDAETVIVEGRLSDERAFDNWDLAGVLQPTGTFHEIVTRLLVRMSDREILDAEAEMIHTPHDECIATLKSVKRVIGLKVTSGYVKQVLARLSGVKGCTHLTHLLTNMSPAIFHGIVVIQRRDRAPLPKRVDELPDMENLVGSCKMWEPGGLKLQGIQAAIEKEHGGS